jgi:hypothetical protein
MHLTKRLTLIRLLSSRHRGSRLDGPWRPASPCARSVGVVVGRRTRHRVGQPASARPRATAAPGNTTSRSIQSDRRVRLARAFSIEASIRSPHRLNGQSPGARSATHPTAGRARHDWPRIRDHRPGAAPWQAHSPARNARIWPATDGTVGDVATARRTSWRDRSAASGPSAAQAATKASGVLASSGPPAPHR